MPIPIRWEDPEQTIVRYDFEGHWTWDEYFAAMNQIYQMFGSVEHRVDAIANMKPGIMPIGGSAMSAARSALRKLPPNRGVIVIIINPFISAMLSAFKQFDREFGTFLRSANSVEEARLLIQREREKAAQPEQP